MSHQRARDRWVTIPAESAPTAVPHSRRSRRTVAVTPLHNPIAPRVAQPVLLPIIGANDELIPAVEERLRPVALRAKEGDRAARNGLYAAFEPKIIRIARRLSIPRAHGTDTGVWDRDDVYQEAFIVFSDLVVTWPVDIPFGRYLLANIPWRLRDAVYRGVGRRGIPPRTNAVPIEQAHWLADNSTEVDEARALIDAIAARLPELHGQILVAHVFDGRPLTHIARDLGISRRTVTRYWLQVRQHLAADVQWARPDQELAPDPFRQPAEDRR
jgi:RNA polymerase sigma factor (sigma-70 family)